jgi:5-amino-6-(5-phosphoribosylamino)uracil reductase
MDTVAPVIFRRLYPEAGEAGLDELYAGLRLHERAPEDRPYLVLNMVSTVDGRATVHGHSGDVGSDADFAVFNRLRTQADAIMVGAGTVRIEGYGRMVRSDELQDLREAEGLERQPLAVTVSSSLEFPPDAGLIADPESRLVVLTGSNGEIAGAKARIEYLRQEHLPGAAIELAPLLRRLRTEHGVRSILCEGGPHLNAPLLAEGLVDELFLTLSPKLAGGPDPLTIVAGAPLPEPAEMELLGAAELDGELYLRYRLNPLRA